jgi:hypothetical protein
MATNYPTTDPQWPYQQPPKAGMKGSTKFLIGAGIGCGVLLLLCCGGGVGVVYYGSRSMSNDPQAVRQVTDSMIAMDIPPEFHPAMSFGMKWFFTMALWQDDRGNQIILGTPGSVISGRDQAQVAEQMEQSMRRQEQGKRGFVAQRSEQRNLKIRGADVPFTFGRGKDRDTGRERLQISGAVQGKEPLVWLVVLTDPKDEATMVKMIESIH